MVRYLTLAVSLAFPLGMQAADRIKFQLCKHGTGEPAVKNGEGLLVDGISTKSFAWIPANSINIMIPIQGGRCTILGLSSGNQASVVGSPAEIDCKITGGPRCDTK